MGNEIYSELNKIRDMVRKKLGKKYADIPRMTSNYYLYPTPQDVLIEKEIEIRLIRLIARDTIYEWNLDGLSKRQLSILVYHMLMYSTIAKDTIF